VTDDPYRIMMPPPTRQRRLLGFALAILMGSGLALASYYFAVATPIPLWVPIASLAGGLIFGLFLCAFALRRYRTKKGRYVPTLLTVTLAVFGPDFVAWLAGQPDSLSFFLTYFLALMAGFCLSMLLLGWGWGSRSYPLTT
jgi:hypothetical protein